MNSKIRSNRGIQTIVRVGPAKPIQHNQTSFEAHTYTPLSQNQVTYAESSYIPALAAYLQHDVIMMH